MSMLQIKPDPAAPMGGVALLRLPANALLEDQTYVQVQNAFVQLWLAPNSGEETLVQVSDANWQADPHRFGPYAVTREGPEAVVRIGPEIVNKLTVFAPIVLRIGGRDYDVNWPDDVPPRAGAALMGALKATAAQGPTSDAVRLVGRRSNAEEAELQTGGHPGSDDPETGGTAPGGDPGMTKQGGTKRLMLFGGLGVVALVAALAAAFLFRAPEEAAPVLTPAAQQSAEPAQPLSVNCSLEALAGLAGGFQARAEALAGACGAALGSEGAFRLIEQSAQAGDAQAWLALGSLYDPTFTDPLLEGSLGIAPGDNLPLAAEYYDRAGIAGAAEAAERLARVCESLAGRSDTLSRGARNDFCR